MNIEEIKKRVENMISRDEQGVENVDDWETWKDVLQLELMIKIVEGLNHVSGRLEEVERPKVVKYTFSNDDIRKAYFKYRESNPACTVSARSFVAGYNAALTTKVE